MSTPYDLEPSQTPPIIWAVPARPQQLHDTLRSLRHQLCYPTAPRASLSAQQVQIPASDLMDIVRPQLGHELPSATIESVDATSSAESVARPRWPSSRHEDSLTMTATARWNVIIPLSTIPTFTRHSPFLVLSSFPSAPHTSSAVHKCTSQHVPTHPAPQSRPTTCCHESSVYTTKLGRNKLFDTLL